MNQIPIYNNPINMQQGTPLYTYQPVSNQIQTPVNNVPIQNGVVPVYQYPTTSLYPGGTGQVASGVNINIYNPTGMGGNTQSVPCSTIQPQANVQPQQAASMNSAPIQTNQQNNTNASNSNAAAAPINKSDEAKNNEGQNKEVVELTDDYIKTMENYLRSQDANVRKMAINQLIKRFEEDSSRYDNPALTALINIALQDPDENNRLLAMAPIASGSAHGDENTVKFLQNLLNSDKLYGQEAKMASEALLNTSQTKSKN